VSGHQGETVISNWYRTSSEISIKPIYFHYCYRWTH